jgi:hypothetical protein
VNGRPLLALGVLLVVAGCGSQYPGNNVGQQVESWATTSPDPKFAPAMSMLQGDLRRVVAAEASDDASVQRTDCDVLVTDALSANQNLPTPDGELTNVLSRAYSAAANAGKDCLCAGGAHTCTAGALGRTGLLKRSAAEGAAARRGFIEAEARVDLLSILGGKR